MERSTYSAMYNEGRHVESKMEKAALSVEGACHYISLSRPALYRLMGTGIIPSFHIGRKRLLLKEHLDSFLAARLAEAEAERSWKGDI